eukprot:5257674-Amphidinium_carterae.2
MVNGMMERATNSHNHMVISRMALGSHQPMDTKPPWHNFGKGKKGQLPIANIAAGDTRGGRR